ncbi:MAG: DNA gyrase inhibitor YacG [Sphingomonadales bacterium]
MKDESVQPMPMTPSNTACPICKKPATERYRPFCSKRCSDVDLGRWLGERYALPDEEPVSDAINNEDEPAAARD